MEIENFYKQTRKIEGWFSPTDAVVFEALLINQKTLNVLGDMLEIGVYQGKSTVFMGMFKNANESFEVCDLFDSKTDLENQEEISRSYRNLNRKLFEENCLGHLGYLPRIHQMNSNTLLSSLTQKSFRFIHIDGSHIYENVLRDLELSENLLISDVGYLVIDDYRSEHTLGVALATAKVLANGRWRVALTTPQKMYLIKSVNSKTEDNLIFRRVIENEGLSVTVENIYGYEYLRITSSDRFAGFAIPRFWRKFIPPVLFSLVRKIRESIF